jgi:hypothetical protein
MYNQHDLLQEETNHFHKGIFFIKKKTLKNEEMLRRKSK